MSDLNQSVSHPTRMPACKFFGNDGKVSALRGKLHENYALWDETSTVLVNLKRVLGVIFPPRPAPAEEESLNCPICDCYKLNSEIPDQTCENAKCPRVFHHTCLFEWLRTISNRPSFDTLFGKCPNCSSDISVQALRS